MLSAEDWARYLQDRPSLTRCSEEDNWSCSLGGKSGLPSSVTITVRDLEITAISVSLKEPSDFLIAQDVVENKKKKLASFVDPL